jgi:hypothetical protein
MAVTVVTGGTFPTGDGQRPGLYVRFMEAAIAAIGTGSRSKVGTLKTTFSGTAQADKVYRITNMSQATELFGAVNIEDIGLMFKGGASEVVVATTGPAPDTQAYQSALYRLETYDFHVFVVPPGASAANDEVFTWLQTARQNGKNFVVVVTDPTIDETDIEAVKTASNAYNDEYVVFVANGVKDANGNAVPVDKYACYIAGLIAGMPLDSSLTYYEVPFTETATRYRASEVQELLEAGILVTVMDGDSPRIEQGLTKGEEPFNKIRTVRAKQAMIDDIGRAVNDNYVGKITNNEDGRIAVINAIKTYLETMANANVIDRNFKVELDKTIPSTGAEMYVNITVKFLDSIEYVYLTITL